MQYYAKLQGQKVHEYLAFPLLCTGLGKRVVPRLRESRLLAPSGRGREFTQPRDHSFAERSRSPQNC